MKISYIYRLYNIENEFKYIRSTLTTLSKRFSVHKCYAKTEKSRLYFYTQIIGFDKFKIEEITRYVDISKDELHRKKQEEIDKRDKSKLLNENKTITTYEEKLKHMRDWYSKKMQDPKWAKNKRERIKIAIRVYRKNKKL